MKQFHGNFAAALILGWAWLAHGAETPPRPAPASPPPPTSAAAAPTPTPQKAAPAAPPVKPAGATAQPAQKPNLYVRLIERLYQEGQPDAAMIAVRTASGSPEIGNKALAQVAVLEGLLHVDQIEEENARAAFKRAFALDYHAALPSYASSKAVQLFQEAQAEYRKTNKPPPPAPPAPADPFKGSEWRWGLVGGGAIGAVAGIAVLAGSNGQQNTFGGALLGAGVVSAVVGIVALNVQPPETSGSTVSVAVTPRGDVLATFGARF